MVNVLVKIQIQEASSGDAGEHNEQTTVHDSAISQAQLELGQIKNISILSFDQRWEQYLNVDP